MQRVLGAAAAAPRTEYTLLAELRETAEVIGGGSLYVRNAASRSGMYLSFTVQ